MDIEQSLSDGYIENGSRPGVDNRYESYSTPYKSVFHSDGQGKSVSEPTEYLSNFSTVNLYAPNCPTMTTAVSAPLRPPPLPQNTPRWRLPKTTRYPPCPHEYNALPPRRSAVVKDNTECLNCGTKITSAWRLNAEGKIECNACYSFFRRNGRKRPASMRSDTIARRFRRSRCKLCKKEAEDKPTNPGQFQKACPETAISQGNTVQLSDPNHSQSTVAQNFFVLSNASCASSQPTFASSNVHYSTQNPMMISYNNEPSAFRVTNMKQKTSQSDQLSFTKHSRGASSESSVFGNSALVAAPNPFSNVRNYDLVNKVFSFVDHMAEDQQKQPCRSSTESPDQNEPIAGNMFSNNQFEAQHSVAYSIINEECRSSILPNCSSISHTTPLEVDSSSAGAPGNALSDMFALFRDHNNEENEEKTAVFLPL